MLDVAEQQRTIKTLNASLMPEENPAKRSALLAPRSGNRQKSVARIDWLSASIIHDLRNPLGTVIAGAEMLMELDPTSNQVKRLATNIYRAAGRMRELLAGLAAASRGNRSASEICNVRDIIFAATDAAFQAAENRTVRISNNIPSNVEIPLERGRIECVFFNLILNALEAMPDGGKIRIGVRQAEHFVLIEVEDTGPGIPMEIRGRLFEPFVTAGKGHGLGLGLAVSRQTVRDHGGDIWLEPASGARFLVRFPLKRNENVL